MQLIHVNRFANQFDPKVKQEGYGFYARDLVRMVRDGDTRADFQVDGETECAMEIRARSLRLGCSCRAPELCTHLWSCFALLESMNPLFGHNLKFADRLELNHRALGFTGPSVAAAPEPEPEPEPERPEVDEPTKDLFPDDFDFSELREDADERLIYFIDCNDLRRNEQCFVERICQCRGKDGQWCRPAMQNLSERALESMATELDMILAEAFEQSARDDAGIFSFGVEMCPRISMGHPKFAEILQILQRTGRLYFRDGQALCPAGLDLPDLACTIKVSLHKNGRVTLRHELRDADNRVVKPDAFFLSGIVVVGDGFACIQPFEPELRDLLCALEKQGTWDLPKANKLLGALSSDLLDACVRFKKDSRLERIEEAPEPVIAIKPHPLWTPADRLAVEPCFRYAGAVFSIGDRHKSSVAIQEQLQVVRAHEREQELAEAIVQLPFLAKDSFNGDAYVVRSARVTDLVAPAVAAGWRVEWGDNLVLNPEAVQFDVRALKSAINVRADVQFGDRNAPLSKVLDAWDSGESFVKLDGGAMGVLSGDWLGEYRFLTKLCRRNNDQFSFERNQLGLVEVLVSKQDNVRMNKGYKEMRRSILDRDAIMAREPGPGFHGELRPYQKDGFAWLLYLHEFGFGGCLADDMGLGKTIQILALLDHQRENADKPIPSLIVLPRSLLHNWKAEAERFTPELRVAIHHGSNRSFDSDFLDGVDVVLTTYGTLRNDIDLIETFGFSYCILDEAQAVKNAKSLAAKAVRRVKARHRLALTGTPVENHLGEIWSIFEFLNPGILGAGTRFQKEIDEGRDIDPIQIEILARTLKPFLLRRTKEQVLDDLPEKIEQTLLCDLDGDHLTAYEQLREEFRIEIENQIHQRGFGQSKIMILEALLRLRQCACHPALIAETWADSASTKFELLLEELQDIIASGHKALVFSQFTSVLGLLRRDLDAANINYAYLDGKTRKRQEVVEQFQTDPDCAAFLISLKAGGLGLNLTAADYVFILDPWWNPAAESQAIDRAHRIGQTRKVFAYRIIAAGTIEERIAVLQEQKRQLADAILSGGNTSLRDLDQADLDYLFS